MDERQTGAGRVKTLPRYEVNLAAQRFCGAA